MEVCNNGQWYDRFNRVLETRASRSSDTRSLVGVAGRHLHPPSCRAVRNVGVGGGAASEFQRRDVSPKSDPLALALLRNSQNESMLIMR